MDFGLDNEFESDDSFFDDPKAAKKPKTAENKSLEDIFGFQEDKKPEKSGPSSLENVEKPKVRFNVETPAPTEKPDKPPDSSKNKTPDWLGGSDSIDYLKKDPLPPKTNPKTDLFDDALAKSKSFDLLDDILPQRGKKSDHGKTTSFEDILRDSKAQKSGPGSLEKSGVEQKSGPGSLEVSAAKRIPSEGLSMILEPPQGARRGRRGSNTGVTDVLGLFGSGPSSSEFIGGSKMATSEEKSLGKDVPDWLGGSSTTLNKSETSIPQPKPEQKDLELPQPLPQQSLQPQTTLPNAPQAPTFQSNMSNLQTQESFLLVSLQLKKYEETLSDIKNQQQEILKKQEKQFDAFLNQYIEKQKGIEQEMLGQQERINEHIRIMALKDWRVVKAEDVDERDDNTDAKIVQGLKQRHDEEFFLMEESYKKQISLLEKSSEQLEHRLSQDIDKTSKLYEEKLEALKAQHSEEIQYWTDKLKTLDDTHREEIEKAKENHSRAIREVKDEFLDQLERFKEQRTRESELFAGSADFSQQLNSSLEKLNKNEEILAHIQDKVVGDYSILSAARERSLETKEKDIAAMRVALEKCREQAEKDRSQLLALVGTLELKLSEQSRNSQEERWALQQAAATIAARSAAFDREIEFSRASIERERKQLKTLKESLLAERERAALELTEQKLKLSAERSRLEVSAKLVNNYEVEKIKTEAETAIQVAKELTEKLNLERSFVQRQKLELEGVRNKLMERERDLLEREESVEEMRREAQQKSVEDRRLIQDTRHLEIRYKEKLSELQSQAISLSNREKKLAEEKLLVSKEKLALYTAAKTQGGHKKCMLCKAEEETYLGHPATEPELIKLRMEAIEDELNSEVSREDNNN